MACSAGVSAPASYFSRPFPMTVEKHSQLKALIARGKEKGYLTYAEVNDHLPDDIVDPEQIEDIVNMIADMGITVHEEAPDEDQLMMADAPVTDDDDDDDPITRLRGREVLDSPSRDGDARASVSCTAPTIAANITSSTAAIIDCTSGGEEDVDMWLDKALAGSDTVETEHAEEEGQLDDWLDGVIE